MFEFLTSYWCGPTHSRHWHNITAMLEILRIYQVNKKIKKNTPLTLQNQKLSLIPIIWTRSKAIYMLLVITSWTDRQEISRDWVLCIIIQEKNFRLYFTLSKDHSVQLHGNRAKQWKNYANWQCLTFPNGKLSIFKPMAEVGCATALFLPYNGT